ncbi:hypothetical protein POM88_017013 [Heracleum sosnowskyi]|uniref:Uncharacterized protein n=1 Tax=Heracleum sosnowskyi TaxID=360622 RepID=A0AAD8IND2_9APIA|nr:hypothetical protein POM88_017013 [Heracleum sosnowskyi]
MSTTKYESMKIPILKKSEYPTWKVKMLMYLEAMDPDYLDRIHSNTKFLRALPEEWDTQTSIIRHQYDLNTVSLDEVYGMLRTQDLEVQQRKNKRSSKAKSIALNVEAKLKGKAMEVSRRKSRVVESDPDDSSSDTDGNPDANC